MTARKLRFAIFGNTYQPDNAALVQNIVDCLSKRGAEVLIERDFYAAIAPTSPQLASAVCCFDDSRFSAHFVISVGGDGTFLKAASMVGSKQTPMLGVNTGRLGFLADTNVQDIAGTIDALYRGDYTIDRRPLISVETDGQPLAGYNCALNDVAILKRDDASMITIRATVDGHYLTTYQADGLVVSTSTGSTAYSLSNGGPIIVPGTRVFSLTAVAPHSLNTRPIVLSEESEIELTVESRTHNFLVALDGRSENLPDTTRLTLRKAPYCIQTVRCCGTNYFQTLRRKMMWGADQRG